jgi:hypothetical protein
VMLDLATRALMQNNSGNCSAMRRVFRPMEPVDPSMQRDFIATR